MKILKFIAIKIALAIFKTLSLLKRLVVFIFNNWLIKLLGKIYIFLMKTVGIGAYKIHLKVKYRLESIQPTSAVSPFHLLTNRNVVHIIMTICACLVAITNIQAISIREENFGEKSLMYFLVSHEELGYLIEETVDLTPSASSEGYLADKALPEKKLPGENTENPTEENNAATVEGGTAVIKPNIPTFTTTEAMMNIHDYVVQTGDTLEGIAKRFAITIDTILWENNITAKTILKPGRILSILPVSGVKHQVKRGENISSIAKKYKIAPDEIMKFNQLTTAANLQINQVLIIPGGKKIIVAPAPTTTSRLTSVKTFFTTEKPVITNSTLQWPASCRYLTTYSHWGHVAVDIACKLGTPIYAAEDGTVTRATTGGWNGGYGNVIMIDHGNGIITLYGHNRKILVGVGDRVSRGQQIAEMGSTGKSTGPHCHFEVRVNGSLTNPLKYIK